MTNYVKRSEIYFTSKSAQFQLSVEFGGTKVKADNTTGPLVYVTKKGTLYSNPNMYLVLSHVEDDYTHNESVYSSFMHTYKLRQFFKKVRDLANSETTYSFFVKTNGVMEVNPEYANGLTLPGFALGKSITLFPAITKTDDSMEAIPAICFTISNGFTSVFTLDEFDAVYQLIMDINLVNLQAIMSNDFINNNEFSNPAPTQQYRGNGYQPAQYAAQPARQQNAYRQPQQYQQPVVQQQYQQPVAQPQYQQPQAPQYSRPQRQFQQPVAQTGEQPQAQQQIRPRGETLDKQPTDNGNKIMNAKNIMEEAENIQINLDEVNSDTIFGED